MKAKTKIQIKIEKNVPMTNKRKSQFVQAFTQMEVGDSFFIPQKNDAIRALNAINGYIRYHKGVSAIATRSEGVGLRIWRIK
jgi:hypothetical protein